MPQGGFTEPRLAGEALHRAPTAAACCPACELHQGLALVPHLEVPMPQTMWALDQEAGTRTGAHEQGHTNRPATMLGGWRTVTISSPCLHNCFQICGQDRSPSGHGGRACQGMGGGPVGLWERVRPVVQVAGRQQGGGAGS